MIGKFWNAYILRTMGSSEFNYEGAKRHLMNLNLDALGTQTMQFSTVAEGEADPETNHQHSGHGQVRLMRLSTWVNLESHISVSVFMIFRIYLLIPAHCRLDAPERSSATCNAERLRNTFRTTPT